MAFEYNYKYNYTQCYTCNEDGRGETTTCLKTVVGGRQRHAPCKVLSLQHNLFLCQLNFNEIIRLS